MEIVIPEDSLGTFVIYPVHRMRLMKIILHEVGHWVLSRRFGFKVGQIRICWLYEGGQYDCWASNDTARRLLNTADIELFIEERILVLFAGAMAESLDEGKVDSKAACDVLTNGGGRNDEGKISEFIHLLINIRYAFLDDDAVFKKAEIDVTKELWDKTKALVESYHEVISALAEEINSKVIRGGEEYIFSEEDLQTLLDLCETSKAN